MKAISYYDYLKRMMDVALSIIGIALSLPILIIVIVFIVLESEGGWLYKQQRVGQHGEIFTIYKLRTMYLNSKEQWTTIDDPRITKVGRFIRKVRIDELPQLINVLRGEMSIVGPRPERPEFERVFEQEISDFKERLIVKPGITGWAQVNGGYNISIREKLRYDIYYICNRSIPLDIKILFMTIYVIITTKGAR